MKSRAISALVFGLCFGLIFMVISFFVPPITRYTCGGVTTYELITITIGDGKGCTGGTTTETVGFPFSTKKKFTGSSINYEGLGIENPSHDFEFQPTGIIGNLIAYWFLGSIFFFVFSRSNRQRNPKRPKY